MKVCVVACMLAAVAFRLAAADVAPSPVPGVLTVGYYNDKCSISVESIVNDTVIAELQADISKAAGLLRLMFHDCFVRGCDGSILLDQSTVNPSPEKASGANIGLDAALGVIDKIKAELESACPGVVSCADIVVFAARDASRYMSNGGVNFDVPAGRLDGIISSSTEATASLPNPTSDIATLIANFGAKGFTAEELVILTGAHAIGKGHCSSFTDRLTAPSSEINANYRDNVLNKTCAAGASTTVANNIRDIDAATLGNLTSYVIPAVGGDYLDNSFYTNNKNNLVLFHSDWALVNNSATLKSVDEYAKNGTLWNIDFAQALVKLSKLAMPAGSVCQIRKKTCRAIN